MPLATVRIDNENVDLDLEHHYNEARSNTPPREITSTAERFDDRIVIRQLVAGPWLTKQEIVDAASSKTDALVIHGTGLGHLPIEDSNGDTPQNLELRDAIEQLNIPALIVNQCIHGPVNMNVYSKGRIQQEIGLLGHGITSSPEAAIMKLHFALSNGMDVGLVMSQNLIGEQQQTILD